MSKYLTPKDEYDNYEEYYLLKENNAYKLIIEINENELIIRHKKYTISMNHDDLSLLTKIMFNTIYDAYEYIINLFEKNKVAIKEIKRKNNIILLLNIYINNIEEEIEISLSYKSQCNIPKKGDENLIEITNLKKEIDLLKNEINEIKNNNNNKKQKSKVLNNISNNNKLINYSNPEKISFTNTLIKDSHSGIILDNAISVFKSIDNNFLVIYGNKKNSIISYNLIKNQIHKEKKNAHDKNIINIRHHLDTINNRDLILSLSYNNLKIWDVSFKCLSNLENINQKNPLSTGIVLSFNNQNYIITANFNFHNKKEPIRIFEFNGKKINEIDNSYNHTSIIETYYDINYDKNYIITGNEDCVASYDYNKNEIYHRYHESSDNSYAGDHNSILINNIEDTIKLIESSSEGVLRIWNFHNRELLSKFKLINKRLFGICLWNNNNLFVGCDDNTIKLINVNKGKIISSLSGHREKVSTIIKLIHPIYGECLISYGGDIILWTKK